MRVISQKNLEMSQGLSRNWNFENPSTNGGVSLYWPIRVIPQAAINVTWPIPGLWLAGQSIYLWCRYFFLNWKKFVTNSPHMHLCCVLGSGSKAQLWLVISLDWFELQRWMRPFWNWQNLAYVLQYVVVMCDRIFLTRFATSVFARFARSTDVASLGENIFGFLLKILADF